MAGHVRRRGNRWEVWVSAGRDPLTGKRVQARASCALDEDPEEIKAELLLQVRRGLYNTSRDASTVAELMQMWIADCSPDWSPGTTKETRGRVGRYLGSIKDKPLRQLRVVDINRLYSSLRAGGGRKGRPLSGATVLRVHVDLHSALEHAVRSELLVTNPADRARKPKVVQTEVEPPTDAEVEKLYLEALEHDPDLVVFVLLAVVAGARRGEVAALRWGDVDLERGRLRIRRTLVDAGEGQVVEKDTKGHDRYRPVFIDEQTIEDLREHRKRCEQRLASDGYALTDVSPLFPRPRDLSRPWRPDLATHRFSRLRAKLGLDSVRLQDLRHYMCTTLLDEGVPLTAVSRRAGHARRSTTSDIYGHGTEAGDRHAAEVMGRKRPGRR